MCNSENKHDKYICAAAFFASVVMALIIAYAAGLAPFGDKTLIISDAESQYTSFWAYFRRILTGESSPLYSLQMTLGGNVLGLLGYYTLSPLNLLFLLFPVENMPLAVHLIILLKLGLCGLFTALYLRNTTLLSLKSLIFSLSYTFSGFVISFCWCIMWLDAVMLLPLIALGIRKLFAGGRPWLYICALSAAIISCYYMGFILCIFSVLYFLYLLIRSREKTGMGVFLNYAFSSAACGGLAAFILLPSVMSMQDSKILPYSVLVKIHTKSLAGNLSHIAEKFIPSGSAAGEFISAHILAVAALLMIIALCLLFFICRSRKIKGWVKISLLIAFITLCLSYGAVYERGGFFMHKMLLGAESYQEMWDGYPNIYSGIAAAVLGLYFFMCRDIGAREKLAAALFMLVLLFSMHFTLLNSVWHGFTKNNCFNYRYSFIFSFMLVSLAAEGAEHIKKFGIKELAGVLAFTAALMAAAFLCPRKLAPAGAYAIIGAEILILSILFMLSGHKNAALRKAAAIIICPVVLISLFSQSLVSIKNFTGDSSFEKFRSEYRENSAAADKLLSADGGIYRSDIIKTKNGPMMYGLNGLSHFSSNERASVVNYLFAQGVASMPPVYSSHIFGTASAVDCFYGVKYLTEPLNPGFYEEFSGDAYINPLAFPLAFCADGRVLTDKPDSEIPFENINTLFEAVNPGTDKKVFSQLTPVSVKKINLRENEKGSLSLIDSSREGEIIYEFRAESSDPLYCYSLKPEELPCPIYLNGEEISELEPFYDWRFHFLGSFEPGESFELSRRLEPGDGETYDNLIAASESREAIEAHYSAVMKYPCEIRRFSDSKWEISLSVPEDSCLLMTLPYDSGWQVKLDSDKAEAREALGMFLAVPLSGGEHVIELSFVPGGLAAGAGISAACLGAVIIWAIVLRRKKSGRS